MNNPDKVISSMNSYRMHRNIEHLNVFKCDCFFQIFVLANHFYWFQVQKVLIVHSRKISAWKISHATIQNVIKQQKVFAIKMLNHLVSQVLFFVCFSMQRYILSTIVIWIGIQIKLMINIYMCLLFTCIFNV